MVVLFSLAACGGGGIGPVRGPSAPAGATLRIETTSLPGAAVNVAYPVTQLQATGAQGPASWQVTSGALPAGLALSKSGVIAGTTPAVTGSYDFTVQVMDSVATAAQPLTIVLSNMQLVVTSGQVFGDLWTERAVVISAAGQSGTVTFEITTNSSGGALSDIDAAAGTARYTPGSAGDVVDVIQVSDASAGSASLSLDIEPNPLANHTASFGDTDVWYMETDVKRGSHAYSTDLHDALASIGLWPAGSTGPAANDFERLIETLVRVQVLRELNLIYLRESDGSAGADGLDITFPFDAPDAASYSAPSPGSTLGGASTRYSVMEFSDAVTQSSGVLGVAFVDGNNDRHENDGGDDLGVLTDRVTSSFSGWQSARLLDGDPVTPSDEPILRALLYGDSLAGARFSEIKTLLEYWSRAIAIVTAHEVGHSLGLGHNGSGGTLMASSIGFSTSNLQDSNGVPLTNGEITSLRTDLPGPGKSSAALTLFGLEMESTGGETIAFKAESPK